MKSPCEPCRRQRLALAGRVLAATVGGYAVTALTCAALARALVAWASVDRADAVLWTTLGSFALYAACAVTAFGTRRALDAWRVLAVVALISGAVLLLAPAGHG